MVLVENLSVPFDRRVWQESRTLSQAGYEVHVICPMGAKQDTEEYVELEGVHIHRYPLEAATGGALGYPREYGQAMWHTLRIALRLARQGRFDVIHACNPPDLYWLVGLLFKAQGTKFLYDQHDLVPELMLSRFGSNRAMYRLCMLLERATFAVADHVISTNGSYRAVALGRGRKAPGQVDIVRSAPDTARFNLAKPDPALKGDTPFLLGYLGVMGPQDGLDYALRALAYLRHDLGRTDWKAVFVGGGDTLEESIELAEELKIGDRVTFTGRVPDDELCTWLSSADVCLAPDPKNPLNDVSTMNKIMEYMALGRPLVSFDLIEARVSAGEAAVYAPANEEPAFAQAIADLLDDPAKRAEMSRLGRMRVAGELSWKTSARNLRRAYRTVLGLAEDPIPERAPAEPAEPAVAAVPRPVGVGAMASPMPAAAARGLSEQAS